MLIRIFLLLAISANTFSSDYSGFEIDNKEKNEKYKIDLLSGKKDSLRFYKGAQTKVLNDKIQDVVLSITNFDEKCNNDYKDRRELVSKDQDCKYHNGNLVESKVYKPLKKYEKEPNEIDRYLVARRIYNRQSFSHIDLVVIYQSINKKGQKVIRVSQRMIEDKEAKKYIKPPVEYDSVFQVAKSSFTLTEISPKKTQLEYFYASETDHWLLNKSVSVSKVFESMAKSIDLLLSSIDQELAQQSTIKTKVVTK
jgi:hypothetical protein